MCPNCCLKGVDCSLMHPKTDRQVCFILCLTAGGILFLYTGCHSVMLQEEQQNGKMVLWCTLQMLDTGRRRKAKLRINTHVEGHLSKGTKLAHWTIQTGCSRNLPVRVCNVCFKKVQDSILGSQVILAGAPRKFLQSGLREHWKSWGDHQNAFITPVHSSHSHFIRPIEMIGWPTSLSNYIFASHLALCRCTLHNMWDNMSQS